MPQKMLKKVRWEAPRLSDHARGHGLGLGFCLGFGLLFRRLLVCFGVLIVLELLLPSPLLGTFILLSSRDQHDPTMPVAFSHRFRGCWHGLVLEGHLNHGVLRKGLHRGLLCHGFRDDARLQGRCLHRRGRYLLCWRELVRRLHGGPDHWAPIGPILCQGLREGLRSHLLRRDEACLPIARTANHRDGSFLHTLGA